MPYLLISDFKFGMDRRRERVSGIPGTLWTGKNVHISRGGDVKRTKKFVSRFTLPAGSHGLATLGEQLFVFDDTNLSATIPAGVNFQQLIAPNTPTMTRVLDAKAFAGKMYVIAEYDDGNVYHFYDSARVTDWDTVADSIFSYTILAQHLAVKISEDAAVEAQSFGETVLITATTPGTAFTAAKATVNGAGLADQDITLTTVQANVAAVAEVQATGSIQVTGGSSAVGVNVISDITVNGVSLLSAPVDWTASNSGTASALVTAINNNTSTHGYVAISSTDTVTITAAIGTGATVNGHVVASVIPATSNVTTTDVNVSGGVTAVVAVAQVVTAALIGTQEADDQFTITIDGTDYKATGRGAATGKSLYIYRSRVYSPVSSLVQYCVVNTPTDWTTTTTVADAGFINVSNDSDGAELLIGMTDYNGLTAVFSEDNVYVYSLSADNSLNSLVTTLRNSGTRARHSILSYGNRDVFYLDESGLRSIQARDSSGDASVDDVGTVIDTFVQDFAATLDESKLPLAQAAVEPKDNLYFLLLGPRIFILSRYPKVRISAWTYMEPSFTPTDIARTPRRLYVRDATTVYLYGGVSGTEYEDDVTEVPVVELPFVSAKDEAGIKMITGIDLACVGEWEVKVLPNPRDDTKELDAGIFRHTTYDLPHAKLGGRTSHVAFKLTGKSAGPITLSSMALHFEKQEQQ